MVTNVEVLERMPERRTLCSSIKKIRNEWIGHVLKRGGLLALIIEGYVEVKTVGEDPGWSIYNK